MDPILNSKLDVTIFFDESGKNTDKPTIMGGLAIPSNLYQTPTFTDLNKIIAEKTIHWTAYGGDGKTKNAIKQIIGAISKYESILKLNVINYDQSKIEENAKIFKDVEEELSGLTIYTKFPERIVYGLLRKYGKHTFLNTHIIIEEANEYKDYDLEDKLTEQLNIQAIYRGENFRVVNSQFKNKGEEIGLELTDLLLGIIRTIIQNKPYEQSSGRVKKKIDLVIELLNEKSFLALLKKTRYFEWSNSNELTEVEFNNYIQVFISSNYERVNFD